MKTIIPILFLALLCACVTPEQNLRSWLDHRQTELMQSWGAPDRIMDDGQGGRILVYTQQVFIPRMQGGGTFADAANNQMPQYVQRTHQFFVNQHGRIYLVR